MSTEVVINCVFPKDKFYIIRWLQDGGYHLYPNKDGDLPEGFDKKEDAEAFVSKWQLEAKIVDGIEAELYPIPKRW